MSTNDIDMSDTLVPKSDQLNADDLIAGPITVRLTSVTKVAVKEQPIIFGIEGHRPWKPCLGMRRLLAEAWESTNPTPWIGRSVTLFRDPDVRWGGELSGGIRVSALSHIERTMKIAVTVSRGKKKLYTVTPLKVAPPVASTAAPKPAGPATPEKMEQWANAAITNRGWTRQQVDALFGGPAADTPPDRRAQMIARLKGAPPVDEPGGDDGEDSADPTPEERARILADENAQAAK